MSLEWPLESLSDDEVLRGLADILRQSRRAESSLVAHIAEVEIRRLYARSACSSLYAYCTDVLHLSEAEAYLRIEVARAARKHPVLLAMLADGRLHLAGIERLASRLTPENRDTLLARAVHKTKRQIEELVAELAPRPDVPGVIRKLPERTKLPEDSERVKVSRPELGLDGVASPVRPDAGRRPTPPPPLFQPLSPARYKVEFTAGAEPREKLERLRALMRHEVPNGDLAAIIEKAVTRELERREARRFARTSSPRKEQAGKGNRPSSRHIPATVRRAVYRRDGGKCCFVDAEGRRCPEHHRLEFHHRHPFGLGGNHDPDNICLMCPAHNRYMAEHDYGKKVMSRHSAQRSKPGRKSSGEWLEAPGTRAAETKSS